MKGQALTPEIKRSSQKAHNVDLNIITNKTLWCVIIYYISNSVVIIIPAVMACNSGQLNTNNWIPMYAK